MIPRIGAYVLAALLVGAHFYRAGEFLVAALCLAAPSLFLYRRRWTLILLQAMAYGAAATWIATAIRLVELRQQIGRPWTAAAVILGAVALFTLAAGLLLNSPAITRRYPA